MTSNRKAGIFPAFFYFEIFLTKTAGFPAHTSFSGMFVRTTLPAPMTAKSPTVMPFIKIESAPIKTYFPIWIGEFLAFESISIVRCSMEVGWKSVSQILQFPPIMVWSPIVISSRQQMVEFEKPTSSPMVNCAFFSMAWIPNFGLILVQDNSWKF